MVGGRVMSGGFADARLVAIGKPTPEGGGSPWNGSVDRVIGSEEAV